MQKLVPVQDLPQALWVVASTIKGSDIELPSAYRFGYAEPLSAPHIGGLTHYLLEKPTVHSLRLHKLDRPDQVPAIPGSVSGYMTDPEMAKQVFEVVVADSRQHRQAIREIKEVVRPECPYTAFVMSSAQKMSGNTVLLWVVVRDELSASEQLRLCGALQSFRQVHSVVVRGASTFEMRVDRQLVKRYNSLTSPLAVVGIFPDFIAETGATTFEKAIKQKLGF